MNKQNKYAFRESSEREVKAVDQQHREERRNRAHLCVRTHFVLFLSTFVFLKRTFPLLCAGGGGLLFFFFTGKEENLSTLGIPDIRRLNQVSINL